MSWRWANIFVLVSCGHFVMAQETRDTLSVAFRDLPLEIVLDSITFKTGYYFSYNADAIPPGSLYVIKKDKIHVDDLLDMLLVGTNLEYVHRDDQVIIRQKEPEEADIKSNADKVTLTGWIREYGSKSPIVGASVFLNGTTIGTVTDEYGNYRLMGVPQGSHILVFSHVGYESAAYPFKAEQGMQYAINGLLDFRVETLRQIEITSTPIVSEDERPKYLRIFEAEFLGNSSNAVRCELLNPEVLDFSYSDSERTLTAEATEPLLLRNDALGYEIKYVLDHFEKDVDQTSFYGKAFFTSLEPGNKRTRRRWEKNRLQTYNGSILHFFKSLTREKLEDQGFKIYHIEGLNDINNHGTELLEEVDVIEPSNNKYEWILDFDGYLLVSYERELESTQYLASLADKDITVNGISPANNVNRQAPGPQRSVLKLKRTYLTLDYNGQIKESLGLTTIGYWSWERVADLMPADYDPKNSKL